MHRNVVTSPIFFLKETWPKQKSKNDHSFIKVSANHFHFTFCTRLNIVLSLIQEIC